MLAEALQAEADAVIARFVDERDERGRRLVVGNGSHQSREVLTSAGVVQVRAAVSASTPTPASVNTVAGGASRAGDSPVGDVLNQTLGLACVVQVPGELGAAGTELLETSAVLRRVGLVTTTS